MGTRPHGQLPRTFREECSWTASDSGDEQAARAELGQLNRIDLRPGGQLRHQLNVIGVARRRRDRIPRQTGLKKQQSLLPGQSEPIVEYPTGLPRADPHEPDGRAAQGTPTTDKMPSVDSPVETPVRG